MVSKEKTFFCKSKDGSITYTTDHKFLYAEKEGVVVRLDLFDGHYYKLRPYNDGIILEIDGLRMQLVRDFKNPMDYSKEVVTALIPKSPKTDFVVLDSCMGLGYTAIAAAAHKSVRMVATCEVSEAVINLAKWNPFSDPVFASDSKIVLVKGSITEIIKTFESEMFSFIIHDPPRLTHAPELYSSEFYKELYRVCKEGGRIFHYVGSVGQGKGRHIDKEVSKRLEACGFRSITYDPRLQGVFARRI